MRRFLITAALTAGFTLLQAADDAKVRTAGQATHPTVGSWVGKAVQICPEPLSSCAKGAIMMTPTVNGDGTFTANDTLELIPPPFGTHTTAHGFWEPTGPKTMVADYVFVNPTLAWTTFPTTTITRLRWGSETIEDDNTMVGYVNVYTAALIPTVWESLGPNQFPTVPKEGYDVVKIPAKDIVKDPKDCTTVPQSACPLVFKFKILRLLTQ
jgi:hypothetical protein